jgi:hypothetical protein
MEGKEKLFNGFGYLIYSIACADGKIQQSEINTLQKLISNLLKKKNTRWPISEGTFYLIHDQQLSHEKAMEIGLSIIEDHRNYFKNDSFETLKSILFEVAKSFNSIEPEEFNALQKLYERLVLLKSR